MQELTLVLEKLGSTIFFSKFNPTGAYRLDLSAPFLKKVFYSEFYIVDTTGHFFSRIVCIIFS
jgi:hypothetical protein